MSELLFKANNPRLKLEIEQYRSEYEALHGETDLTKRYTSTWPADQQEWLFKNHPKRYFDGLPPFMKGYLKGKMALANGAGNLDDMPEQWIRLYLSGNMKLEVGERRR